MVPSTTTVELQLPHEHTIDTSRDVIRARHSAKPSDEGTAAQNVRV